MVRIHTYRMRIIKRDAYTSGEDYTKASATHMARDKATTAIMTAGMDKTMVCPWKNDNDYA